MCSHRLLGRPSPAQVQSNAPEGSICEGRAAASCRGGPASMELAIFSKVGSWLTQSLIWRVGSGRRVGSHEFPLSLSSRLGQEVATERFETQRASQLLGNDDDDNDDSDYNSALKMKPEAGDSRGQTELSRIPRGLFSAYRFISRRRAWKELVPSTEE
jgi:hypothetical protein